MVNKMVEEVAFKGKPDFMDCFKQSVGWFGIGILVFTILYLIVFFTDTTHFDVNIETLKNSINVFTSIPLTTIGQIIIKNCGVTIIILFLSLLLAHSIFAKIYSFLCGNLIPLSFYTFNFQHPIISIIYLLPHGLIELPTFFAGMALAIQLSGDRHNWKYYFKRYISIIVPLFIVAALVEVYITPNVLLWYLNTGFLL